MLISEVPCGSVYAQWMEGYDLRLMMGHFWGEAYYGGPYWWTWEVFILTDRGGYLRVAGPFNTMDLRTARQCVWDYIKEERRKEFWRQPKKESDVTNESLTPELDAFIDKYIEANIDERIDADEPCEHFVDGFIAACKPKHFDELDDDDREIIIDEALEKLGDYRVSLILDDLIGEAVELYEAYHEIAGPVDDEPLPEGLIEDEI